MAYQFFDYHFADFGGSREGSGDSESETPPLDDQDDPISNEPEEGDTAPGVQQARAPLLAVYLTSADTCITTQGFVTGSRTSGAPCEEPGSNDKSNPKDKGKQKQPAESDSGD
eukprot:scaffold387926_cov38-Prasinocladus_malaysianus.AAC.1